MPDNIFTYNGIDPKKDYIEDFKLENGNYKCYCFKCGKYFAGHKRRIQCKECATKAGLV